MTFDERGKTPPDAAGRPNGGFGGARGPFGALRGAWRRYVDGACEGSLVWLAGRAAYWSRALCGALRQAAVQARSAAKRGD